MYGQRFLFGAWSEGHEIPDFLCWASTYDEAKANLGLLSDGRKLQRVTYGDLVEMDMGHESDLWDMNDPVTNCLILRVQDTLVRFLG